MNTARLALVDDDPQFNEYLHTMLRSRGYDVVAFTSGSALLQALHAGEDVDVVLLDVLMPGMDGLDTLKALRQAHPSVQVIMLSGRQVTSTIVDAVRLGAADYVVKPDDPEGLGEAALDAAIRSAFEKTQLTREVARLRLQVSEDSDGALPCWGPGHAMRQVMTMIERVADSDVSVLIRGESGVGKEIIARELHRRSPRRVKPFVKVNCAALPSELLESELFGHERGAFTGAQTARVGKFEYANLGTLMLDEIGEMPAKLQAKLLHVLQDRAFTKLGSNRPIEVDVRIIAATNCDLEAMIQAGTFREDLYYRLQVIEVVVPPLRDRRDEIEPLTEFFLQKYAQRFGRPMPRISQPLRQAMQDYPWPGNVRELENAIKRYVVLQDETLALSELQRPVRPSASPARAMAAVGAAVPAAVAPGGAVATAPPPPPPPPGPAPLGDDPISLHELSKEAALKAERDAIQQALDRFRWNRRKTAEFLGVSYKTLLNKIKECGITDAGDD
ncbi:MAG: sigma-54-dependent transcriptional regulator [Vicinamibacterales bacterium]